MAKRKCAIFGMKTISEIKAGPCVSVKYLKVAEKYLETQGKIK